MPLTYSVLGIMSGSSLDGVDLAFCEFHLSPENTWQYKIIEASTVPYTEEWIKRLKELPSQSGQNLVEADINYGKYLGKLAKDFLKKHRYKTDFIASHGHTIFHQPDNSYTFQLGNGQALATESGITTICDFRTKDILLGGQGAPLVPVGDQLLFPEYDICLNLGGIANLSFLEKGKRLAFDICPANQLLNMLSMQLGHLYDDGGRMARSGVINLEFLRQLNDNAYYNLRSPKSLSNEYVRQTFIPAISNFECSVNDKLRTCLEHIVWAIDRDTSEIPKGTMIVTGGGAHNTFLIDRFKEISKHHIIIPQALLIDYKEALIFAFMGVLKRREENNCLASVTGAKEDCSSGMVFQP